MVVGSKKSARFKYKGSICTYFCLILWFESDWCFCPDGFESDCPETKFQTITS